MRAERGTQLDMIVLDTNVASAIFSDGDYRRPMSLLTNEFVARTYRYILSIQTLRGGSGLGHTRGDGVSKTQDTNYLSSY